MFSMEIWRVLSISWTFTRYPSQELNCWSVLSHTTTCYPPASFPSLLFFSLCCSFSLLSLPLPLSLSSPFLSPSLPPPSLSHFSLPPYSLPHPLPLYLHTLSPQFPHIEFSQKGFCSTVWKQDSEETIPSATISAHIHNTGKVGHKCPPTNTRSLTSSHYRVGVRLKWDWNVLQSSWFSLLPKFLSR